MLVFLPGTREIQDVQEALQRTRELGSSPAQREWVMQLHGSLPPDEQRRVFLRPPAGVIKVVLATNVAETSVTIDDVGVVIDSGRVKEERYLVERRMVRPLPCSSPICMGFRSLSFNVPFSRTVPPAAAPVAASQGGAPPQGSLDDVWVSRASAKQRRGRAGRVQEGIAFHLFPSDAPLAAYTDPEVRPPLPPPFALHLPVPYQRPRAATRSGASRSNSSFCAQRRSASRAPRRTCARASPSRRRPRRWRARW